MQSKRILFMTVFIVLIGGIVAYFLLNNLNEKEQAEEVEELEDYYVNRGDILALETNTDTFNETGDVTDISYAATQRTETRINRWRDISNAYPKIEFPEEDIQNENWDAVLTFFLDSVKDMTEVSTEIAEKAPEGNKPSINNIEFFILNGDVEDFVKEEFEEKGITVE
ncbi:hypothetical protein [Alkalicoccobacillus porphyridii]|uniref:Uncharacterized protein n=1 Tax=Alkalicoccobacillus porphyridii TaxID=2597270 RepID=A0A554A4A1_9BACI|nr:hypothetical protein [Alkalicoccobacillus porphyridii]TSB48506.1 hypothetical protein FN960_02840 [Alkalicoccobacillus porphyridii]